LERYMEVGRMVTFSRMRSCFFMDASWRGIQRRDAKPKKIGS
jgi:hypothetical protein